VRERGLHGDHALDEVLLVVLEADVEDRCLAGGGHVARHLERHRRLALALRAADEHQLARPQSPADRLVHRHEAGRDRHEVIDASRRHSLVEAGEDAERGARLKRALAGIELPVGFRLLLLGDRLVDHGMAGS
jgi:hypothetical protein